MSDLILNLLWFALGALVVAAVWRIESLESRLAKQEEPVPESVNKAGVYHPYRNPQTGRVDMVHQDDYEPIQQMNDFLTMGRSTEEDESIEDFAKHLQVVKRARANR